MFKGDTSYYKCYCYDYGNTKGQSQSRPSSQRKEIRIRGIAPLILNLGTRWSWVVNVTPQPLNPRKGTTISIEQ
jgi:hypothetical protein